MSLFLKAYFLFNVQRWSPPECDRGLLWFRTLLYTSTHFYPECDRGVLWFCTLLHTSTHFYHTSTQSVTEGFYGSARGHFK